MPGDAPQPGEMPRTHGGPRTWADPEAAWWRADPAEAPARPGRPAYAPEALDAHAAGAHDAGRALTPSGGTPTRHAAVDRPHDVLDAERFNTSGRGVGYAARPPAPGTPRPATATGPEPVAADRRAAAARPPQPTAQPTATPVAAATSGPAPSGATTPGALSPGALSPGATTPGATLADTAAPDAAAPDTVTPDAGPSDAGPSDAGPSDAGPSDAGPSDRTATDRTATDPARPDAAPGPDATPAAASPDPDPAPAEPDVMILPEPTGDRPTVVLDRGPRPPADAAPSVLDTSPFWFTPEQRAVADAARPNPAARADARRTVPKPPRPAAPGMAGLVALSLVAVFFAWVSAEPFWLAVGHGAQGTATVTRCTGSGVTQRCTGSFTATDGSVVRRRVVLLGVDPARYGPGAAAPARMVGVDSRQAYVGGTGPLLHLRWTLGFALVLLCGWGIAGLTGAARLDTARARRGALLTSLAGPVALLAGFLAATY